MALSVLITVVSKLSDWVRDAWHHREKREEERIESEKTRALDLVVVQALENRMVRIYDKFSNNPQGKARTYGMSGFDMMNGEHGRYFKAQIDRAPQQIAVHLLEIFDPVFSAGRRSSLDRDEYEILLNEKIQALHELRAEFESPKRHRLRN